MIKGNQAEWGKCFRTVALSSPATAVSYWDTAIALGLGSGDIIILDAITGSCTAILSGHVECVKSVTFSSDGKLLVSGSFDKIVKLWDVQTGGIVKDFSGHEDSVTSVSISADSAMIASGSLDMTIYLWDISTGKCLHVIQSYDWVHQVGFSPTDHKQLVGRVGHNTISHWETNGCQIGPTYDGSHFAFSLDGKHFALCNNNSIIVQTFEPDVERFYVKNGIPILCCFSPNGKLIAAAVDKAAYVWEIARSGSHPIEIFVGHTSYITAITFCSPSSLITTSHEKLVKIWQIGTLPTEFVETNLNPISSPSKEVVPTTLQAKDGITISSDLDGTVRIWDISTGLYRASFQTPAIGSVHRDGQFINGKLIFAWNAEKKIHIHGTSEEELILAPRESRSGIESLKIGGDGSIIFCLGDKYIQAWSIVTGEVLGELEIESSGSVGSLVTDGLRVWACYIESEYWGWDFGIPGSPPVQLPSISPRKLHPNGNLLWDIAHSRVQDVVTGRVVFQLSTTHRRPIDVQWDDEHLVICLGPTDVLILDFTHVLAL